MPNSREKLYNAISSKYDLGTFDEFNKKMDNPDSRKKLYGSISADFDLGSFDEFEVKIGQPEKKKSLDFGTELPYGKTTFNAPSPSIQNTSPSKLPSTSIAERQAEKDSELTKQMVYNDMRYARLSDKQQAQERGYENIKDYYKDRESFLINNYLTDDDKEEARAQNAFVEAKQNGNEQLAAQEMQNLLNAKSKFRQRINEEKKAVDSEEETLKQSLESGMPQDNYDAAIKVLNQKRATLDLMSKPYYEPKKEMDKFLQGNITEVAAVSKPSQTAKEKLEEYTNALYTQLEMMREDLDWDADGALDAYGQDWAIRNQGKGELLDKMYETELKLRNAVKILELNRTPIDNETALGVFGKSFATSLNPASAGKLNTEQIVAQNLQSINEDAGISDAVDKEQKKFAEENAKEYKPYSAKWFAQPAGTSAAIMLEFIPASMATEGAFAATKIGRLVNIAEQYGKIKGLNTTQKYINAINKYKTLKAADTIGKFALKTQAQAVKFGTTSELVSRLFPKEADQVNFTTGYFGGLIGKGAEQLLGGAATSLYKLFGNKAPEAVKAIERLGEQFKFAKDAPKVILGEIGEEFGESLGQIYKESDSWKEISAKLDEQFGTLDKATQFVIQTGIMALGMGGGSAIGSNLMKSSKDAYNKLSREQRAVVDEVLDSVSDEESKVVNDVESKVESEVKEQSPEAAKEAESISTPTIEVETQTIEPINEAQKTENIQVEPTRIEGISIPNEPTTPITDTKKAEEVILGQETPQAGSVVGGDVKPIAQKVKVLGKDVNMYNDYIPSKAEDVEPDAMYSFNADSKDGIPSLLHDIAYANKREVNGVKSENWHASISGEELLKLYPKEQSLKETPKAEAPKVVDDKAERKRKIELLDTEKKIAQLEKELRKAPVRPSKGVLSQKQIRIQIKNYKEQLRELKGLPPRKPITDNVLRINLRAFGTEVDENNLPHEERVVLEAMGRLDSNDADIANSDGNANLRKQHALKAKGGSSIDQIVTDYINENELDESIAPNLRNAIISFVNGGDAYTWMDNIKEREAQNDPDVIRDEDYYNHGYQGANQEELTDEELSELEQEIGKLNDITQEEYEQIKKEFSDTQAGEGTDRLEDKTDSSQPSKEPTEAEINAIAEKASKADRKAIAEAKIDEIADALKDILPSVKGVKKQGAGQDAIIDLIAKAVKALVNTGIEIDEAIKRVRKLLEDKFDTSDVKDFDIKMSLAKEELKDDLEKAGITYRQAIFTVNKFLREVGAEDVITKEELAQALENKKEGKERDGYEAPKSKKTTTEEGGKTKNRKHYDTMMTYLQNLPETVQAYFKANPMGYEELSNATLLKESIEYIKKQGLDKEGNPNAYDKYMSGDVAKELSEAHEVAVGFLLRGALSNQYTELVKDLKTDPTNESLQKQIDALFEKTIALAKRLGEEGTSYGRAVQAYSLFAQNLTDEVSALFYFGKMVEKMAAAAKKQQSSKTKEYKEKANKTISKGKKEAAKETAEYAIKKYNPKTKGSEKVKQYKQEAKEAASKLKDAFSKYRNVGVFYNGWEEAKKDIEVMKALRDYVKAQAKYKAVQVQQIIKEVAEMLGVDASLIDNETIEDIIVKAKKDSESEKVLETVEKERLKRIQNEQKERVDLEELVRKENARIAELRIKEELAQKEATEKLLAKERLKRIQNEIKEAQKKVKELEAKIEKLGKEIVNSPSLTQEAFEGIIEDYYNGNQSTTELEKLIKDRFEVTDTQAKDLAVKLKNSINTHVREKLIKQMGREVEKAEKKLKEQPPKEKKERKDVYQLLIEAHMMGVLNDDAIQDIIAPMFRIPKMTQEDIAFVKDTMNKYLETGDKVRKAELIGKMIKNFNNKSPLSLYQAYDSMWYAMVLSGFSTVDINLIFGEQILKVAAIEYSALQFSRAIVKALKNKTEGGQAAIRALYGYYRMLFQAGNKTPKQMLNIKNWNEGDIPLTETYANVRSVLANGNEVFMQELKDVYYNTKTDTDLRDLSKKQSGLWYNILSGMNIFQKGVPRLLNAIDLIFSTPVKNLFLVPVLEEHYAKQGLKGEALTKAIENDIFNTEERVLEAKAKAKKDRMMIDIAIEEKNGKWIVKDDGATFIKSKTFNTEQEAKQYADKIASEGVKYQKGVLDYLNNKLPIDSTKIAKRIASRYLLTSEPEGTLGALYDKWVTPFKITRQQGYLNPDNNWLKRGLDFTLDKMVVFLRVPFNMFNLAVDATPAGFFRYSNGRILNNYKRLEYGQVEKNLVLIRALIGTATISALLFKQFLIQDGGDDDEKEKEKKQKLVDNWNKMYPNTNLKITNPLFNLPQDGEIVGSLDMLDPLRKKFLIDNNLAKPFSIYDAKTNSWKSYMTDINFISMAIISSQSNYNKYIINDETRFTTTAQKKKEWEEITKFFWANFSGVMLNLSGLKNQQKAAQSLSNAPQAADKFVDVALSGIQTTPALVKQMVQNYDGFLRERVSISTAPEKYLAQKFIPIGGAFFLGDKMYDMHGEEMPFVYGSQSGGILGYVFNKKYGEKEKQRLELANWYNLNGYTRFRDFAKEVANKTVVSKVGDEYLDTPLFTDDKELKKYGLEAAKLAKETVLKKRSLLQKLANIDTSKMPYKKKSYKLPFSKGVDALFSAAYRVTWMKAAYEKGKISKDLYDIEKEKFKMVGDNLEIITETAKIDVEELNNEKTLIEDLFSFGYISE